MAEILSTHPIHNSQEHEPPPCPTEVASPGKKVGVEWRCSCQERFLSIWVAEDGRWREHT